MKIRKMNRLLIPIDVIFPFYESRDYFGKGGNSNSIVAISDLDAYGRCNDSWGLGNMKWRIRRLWKVVPPYDGWSKQYEV